MRTKVITCLVAFLFTFLLTTNLYATSQGFTGNKIIVIDPGHGGIYPGAIANGVREADINLAVGLKVRDTLALSGAKVIMTRTADVNIAPPGASLTADLQGRVDIAKNLGADLFISIHANSGQDSNTIGAISFYPTGHPDDLARAIQAALVKEAGATDKGVRPANFYVLRNSEIPAALIETGFLTNPSEAALLIDDTYQTKLADSICNGIVNYLQSH